MPADTCLSIETRPLPAVPPLSTRHGNGQSWWRRLTALAGNLPRRGDGSRRSSWTFAPALSSVPKARHQAGTTVRRWGLPNETATTELLVTEAVTNALEQSPEPINLTLTLADGLLRGAVEDHATQRALPEQPHLPDPTEESGRGLFLLDALACCWGVEYTATGKIVWFELPCRPSQRSDTT
ncbi:anti-sigma regulatory factor (Ser/Thr protein kinase) [Nonomuraea fuscirosea]|uniref:Anti-sigma regulatory factor (Ser/Thr protein kinase) n=1 Tax=Nonomuraea fuscirosea TaxID=1291556 RepID=A0A2T0LK43_9ACTN|nr:ATP-binding protein [Nonomuraea fuscirosea]PRX43164.1 anti-sigma regulatory factor (Ser/Thr protein kinase) [Nonomuraea fuscirosea]